MACRYRRQAIIWFKRDPAYRRICAPLDVPGEPFLININKDRYSCIQELVGAMAQTVNIIGRPCHEMSFEIWSATLYTAYIT